MCIILNELGYPVIHTRFQSNQSIGSGQDFLRFYGHGGHIDHVTLTVWINIYHLHPWMLFLNLTRSGPVVFEETLKIFKM